MSTYLNINIVTPKDKGSLIEDLVKFYLEHFNNELHNSPNGQINYTLYYNGKCIQREIMEEIVQAFKQAGWASVSYDTISEQKEGTYTMLYVGIK